MSKRKILFIINPISGGKRKSNIPELINQYIDKNIFETEAVFTKAPFHAKELVNKGGFDGYIAVGGDGTINEIASSLIHKESFMGIIPMGSGNGLARHLGIDMNPQLAIKQLNSANTVSIDTCSLNNRPFINMAGVGFDAHIGQVFADSIERGFKTYITKALKEYTSYQPQTYILNNNGQVTSSTAFLISFANSSQYGNNAFIAPWADIKDGMLEVCILKPFKTYHLLSIGYKLFNKKIKSCKFLQTLTVKEIVIERQTEGVVHVDGEPVLLGKRLEVKVLPSSLKILIPT